MTLTPGHFLTVELLTALLEFNLENVPIGYLQRFQLVERLHQDFWKHWHWDYFHNLQQYTKCLKQGKLPEPD
ncbi:hypothetical protein PR048_015362 [Dryococelus australis]|uniref:DUF5641 domain-containing protein n=1 Tax=Dryococelus australis TaxID=614101 RepID=A0ABQ9HGQ9_9NEOP|nr:hypothetical protein PR048_015362 [Dryococelus australis]